MNKITINTHSSIRIEGGGRIIYFDPYEIIDEAHDADMILITHSHYDHMSYEDIKKLIKDGTKFVVPKAIERDFTKLGLKHNDYEAMEPNETIESDGLHIEAVPAYNIGKAFHKKTENWLGYIIELEGERIYIAGDSDATDEMKSLKCDVALVPVGGTYTMNPKEAAEAVNAMKPKIAIPTHYGAVAGDVEDGNLFKSYVDSGIEVLILLH